MAVMGNELMHEYFVARRETLGQLILHAKRDMAASASRVSQDQITTRQWLDALATWFSPQPDRLNEERLEHIQLFNLLGDPLMRLPQPGEVRLEVPDRVHAGERLIVRGTTSLAGRLTLELVCRRDHTRETPPVRASRPESDEQLAGFTCVYEAANDPRWASISRECQAGQFSAELLVPVEARGPSHVRAFIDGPYGHALGACPLRIEGPHKLQRMAERPSATRQ
jgi:hypothetical protein